MNDELKQMRMDIMELKNAMNRNNFVGHQEFAKYSDFTERLKVPVYASLPSTCRVGELISVGGILYTASASNTWTKVGLQS